MRSTALLILFLALMPRAAATQDCRQALVLALDVSGSVNQQEYEQQVRGLADALDSPEIRALILNGMSAPVSVAAFEWSSQNHQLLIQPWITLHDSAALDLLIARIRTHRKQRAGLKTAIGTAMDFAAAMLADMRHCWRRTIDVSGDGKNNAGLTPKQVYSLPRFHGITVNALVVGNPSPDDGAARTVGLTAQDLARYYESEVIFGPDAFAMIADGYKDYARAMRLKLSRELSVPVFGQIPQALAISQGPAYIFHVP